MERILRYEDDVDDVLERVERELRGREGVIVNIEMEFTELGINVNDTVTVDEQEAVVDEIISPTEAEVWLTESEEHKVVDINTIT